MTAGRPRQFDYDAALAAAMHVFWTKGFEGASMPDLTEAMGMNRPSIYAAFGNKEELFKKALSRYSEEAAKVLRDVLSARPLRVALEKFLTGSANSFSCRKTPRGCLAVQGALVGGKDSGAAQKAAKRHREVSIDILRERFDEAVAEGELDKKTDTAALARFYGTVLQGMSVQSVSGLGCDELKAIAAYALEALPRKV